MLDRKAVAEFLTQELRERGIRVPRSVKKKELVEAFCQYVEADHNEWLKEDLEEAFQQYVEDNYEQWLKDNFNSFFERDEINWECIEKRIKSSKEKQTK